MNRLKYGQSVTHLDVLRWATEGSAKCLGRHGYWPNRGWANRQILHFIHWMNCAFRAREIPLQRWSCAAAHQADRVMVAGEWRVVDGSAARR